MDLNKIIYENRRKEVKIIAQKWLDNIKSNLESQVDKKALWIFHKSIRKGNKLTLIELKSLSMDKRREYINASITEDNDVKLYVDNTLTKLDNEIHNQIDSQNAVKDTVHAIDDVVK